MFLSTKRLVAAAKFLVAATKIFFVVPDFVAVTKPFFSVSCHSWKNERTCGLGVVSLSIEMRIAFTGC